MNKSFKWILLSVTLLFFLALTVVPVSANGKPVKIFLNYLPEFSNYGPTDASGVVLVSIGEAWVNLVADGLPVLAAGHYEAWLLDEQAGMMVSLGTFNADADGRVDYYAQLEDIPVADYSYFVVSVEAEPDASPEADARWSIAGVFPNPTLQIVTETPTPPLQVESPGATAGTADPAETGVESGMAETGAPPPMVLPVTGSREVDFLISDAGLTILGLCLVFLVFIFLKRQNLRSKTQQRGGRSR